MIRLYLLVGVAVVWALVALDVVWQDVLGEVPA